MAMETQAHPIIEDGGSLQAIRYERGSLQLLDQRKLPLETVYIDIKGSADGWHAIKDMVIRGAPAIAISAALSLAVEVVHRDRKVDENAQDALEFLESRLKYLASSRPTAVNLVDASTKLQNTAREALVKSSQADSVFKAYVEAAEEMLVADIATNKAIGQNGANYLLSACKNPRGSKGLNILTHCNTGSLATAGYGTALGVIRSLHSLGKLETVFLTETRPYNQGSRLTAYELVHENIPATLVADSAAASLQMSGRVDAVIVGADRIAANGDTANKIGTYSLALAAFHHNIPFYVAAPLTSIDISLPSGKSIEIEERSPLELTHSHGGHGPQIAASGISVWNPAFDVTPAKLITGIITDKGIIVKKDGSATFDVQAFISDDQIPSSVKEMQANGPVVKSDLNFDVQSNHAEYFPLDATSIKSYIGHIPKLAERLGGSRSELNLQEVGDGNLNYVFIVHGPAGSFVIKQALPYVRCVGESWPLALDRSYYEAMALKEHGVLAPEHVPEVYHFDYKMALTIMRYLEPPHIILRKGLISGMVYPLLAEHVSDYMAKTLFNTSLLAITTTKHKSTMAKFAGNVSLCRLTEQVIFTEPYMVALNNHWTSPQLDEDAKAVRLDDLLKLEIAGLKAKFCESSQALIHGDLHTGSIMVTATSTQVIDPEFAFCGPMGFDIGAFLGNLLLAFFSQDGHAVGKNREEYKLWILQTVADSWNLFQKKFITLWDRTWSNPGDAYPAAVYDTPKVRELAQQSYIARIFEDTLGFAAAKMIRRIVGIAHVEDFESVTDKDVRAACERRALNAAKLLLKERRKFSTIGQVLDVIQNIQ